VAQAMGTQTARERRLQATPRAVFLFEPPHPPEMCDSSRRFILNIDEVGISSARRSSPRTRKKNLCGVLRGVALQRGMQGGTS